MDHIVIIRDLVMPITSVIFLFIVSYIFGRGIISNIQCWVYLVGIYIMATILYIIPICYFDLLPQLETDDFYLQAFTLLDNIILGAMEVFTRQMPMVFSLVFLLYVQLFLQIGLLQKDFPECSITYKVIFGCMHFFSGYYMQGFFGFFKNNFEIRPVYYTMHYAAGYLFCISLSCYLCYTIFNRHSKH